MWTSAREMTIEEAKAAGSAPRIVAGTGLDAGTVRARLGAAPDDALVLDVFPEWSVPRELGATTVGEARNWAEAAIAEMVGLSLEAVTTRLRDAHGNAELRTAFADRWPDEESPNGVPGDYECDPGGEIAEEEPEDRPYQAEALEELQRAFTRCSRVVLSLPTGAGKTFVAAKWLADNLRGKALWLTHREELVNQAERELRAVFGRDRRVTRWTSAVKDETGGVVVATVGCMQIPVGPFEILVVDEAHHRAAPTYGEWARYYRFDKELGLTATPERADRLPLGYEAIVQRNFWDLVEQGYLAAPIHHVIETRERYDIREDRIREDFEEASLRQLDNPERNALIVEQFLKGQREYGKTLIFAINVDHAANLMETFRRRAPHVRVATILGTTARSERRGVVADFASGRLDVLINCKVFVEGFDCKDIETVFLSRPTMSAALYCQMVGRGTRVVGGKKTFHLVELEDQLSRYADKLAGFWSLGSRDPERIRAATERAQAEASRAPDEAAPLASVEAFLGPSENVDWGGDAAEWRRTFLLERGRITGVLRVADDFTGRVTPLKVFDVEDARVRAAFDEVLRARGATGEDAFAVQDAAYERHLKGSSLTKYRWFCVAKAVAQGTAPLLDLRT
jgi:superfamily II DNA or RNA helicase